MDIDENAPVIAREEVFIGAPLDSIWSLHADISSWSEWQPDIDSSTIEGPLAVGTVFHWQTYGLSLKFAIRRSTPHDASSGPVLRRALWRYTSGR
jgi:hypothetical protein